MRAMQRTRLCAISARNDLKPTDFLKHNIYFETEGVYPISSWRYAYKVLLFVGEKILRSVKKKNSIVVSKTM